MKKNRLNRLEYLEKLLIRFWFHNAKTNKPQPNQTDSD
jgi:hypothetical protein